jgi:tetratricopeptide (TPR) repeat protein
MADILPLPPQAEEKLYEYGALSAKAEQDGDIAAAEKYFLAAWNSIPDPKLAYDHAQSMAVDLAVFYRNIGQAQKAKDWLPMAREAYGPEPDPHVEFVAATIHYEAGELDEAYALFESLFKEYKSRPFQEEKPEYLAFYLDRAKSKKGK